MIVGYGDNNTLVLFLVESDLQKLRSGLTLEFNGFRQLVKDITVAYAKDKPAMLELLKEANVPFDEATRDKYLRDERTDEGHRRPQ